MIRWERSANGIDQWLSIEETSLKLEYTDLSNTTYYRAFVQSGNCDIEISNVVKVQIDPAPVGGTVAGSTEVCDDGNLGALTLEGHSGSVVEWLSSTTSASGPWTSVSNTTSTLIYEDLAETTYYRAVLSNGVCSDVMSAPATITVYPATVAGVISDATTVCYGDNNGTLQVSSHTGRVTRWELSPTINGPWSTIDNTTTSLTYDDLVSTTFYRAILQSGPCQELPTDPLKITVDGLTVAGEIEGTSTVCGPVNSGLLELKDFTGTSFQWQLSTDGIDWQNASSTQTSLTFNNIQASTYFRVLVQNGVCGSETTNTFQVVFNPLPVVDFESNSVCAGVTTDFSNETSLSFGEESSFLWDFGTGVASVHEDPSYRFPEAGTYDVSLLVTTAAECHSSVTKQVVVHPVPVSAFIQQDVCDGFEMGLTSTSTITSGTIVDVSWDFGDGATGSGGTIGHTYDQDGLFEVAMTITSDFGCVSESTAEVEVFPLASVQFDFDNVCHGQSIDFQNNTSVAGGTATYLWNFGDGNVSQEVNPSHTYSDPGDNQVVLQATTDHGCVTSQTKTAEVFEQPVAKFSVDNECFGDQVSFVDESELVDTYSWQLGDDNTSDLKGPIHNYSTPGTYDVTLFVNNDEGCFDEAMGTVTVYPVPVASFHRIGFMSGGVGKHDQYLRDHFWGDDVLLDFW